MVKPLEARALTAEMLNNANSLRATDKDTAYGHSLIHAKAKLLLPTRSAGVPICSPMCTCIGQSPRARRGRYMSVSGCVVMRTSALRGRGRSSLKLSMSVDLLLHVLHQHVVARLRECALAHISLAYMGAWAPVHKRARVQRARATASRKCDYTLGAHT